MITRRLASCVSLLASTAYHLLDAVAESRLHKSFSTSISIATFVAPFTFHADNGPFCEFFPEPKFGARLRIPNVGSFYRAEIKNGNLVHSPAHSRQRQSHPRPVPFHQNSRRSIRGCRQHGAGGQIRRRFQRSLRPLLDSRGGE